MLAFGAGTCLLAPVAYMAMLTGFHTYDDEGYYLANLGDYLHGHPLLTPYAQVYGPFFYEVMGATFKLLGLAPDNDAGRFVTAAVWLIASLAAGFLAFRLSRNLWLGVAAEFLTFGVLAALTNEPMSTYGLSALLLLGLVGAATFRSSWPCATAALIGAIVGALCLIKINVGGFAAIAVVFAWACSLTERWRRVLLPLVLGVITVLPVVLTLELLSTIWVLELALVVAFSGAAVGVASAFATPRSLPPPSGRWFAAGVAALLITSLGVALAGGTRLIDVWSGLVLVPLQYPRLFTWPLPLNPGYDLVAALSLAAALALRVRRTDLPATAAGLLRIGAGFFTWLSMLLMPNSIFMLALPLAWIATQAPDDTSEDPVGAYTRVLLPVLAVLESLQVYPIAGSQVSMAALLLVPVGAITLGDGIRQLRTSVKSVRSVSPAVLVIAVAVFLLFALTVTAGFKTNTPLGLPGAESVRLQPQTAAQLRQLVAAVNRDCSSLVTFPGMYSFYIWTSQEPPTPVRAELWWLVIDSDEQQSSVQQLTGKPRVCVIKNQQVLAMWSEGRNVPPRPLVEYIDANFVDAGSYGDYQLLVRR